jgi:hypothetical protein
LRYGCAALGVVSTDTPRERLRGIVVATSLTFTMTEKVYGRLTDRLRHVMQFSEASRQAAEEALALLEAAKGKRVEVNAHEINKGDELAQPPDAPNEQLDRSTAELEAARDVDAVFFLLAVHKLVEGQTTGKARSLAQAEALAIIAALNRIAPAVLDDALAISDDQSEPIGVILEAMAPREGRSAAHSA